MEKATLPSSISIWVAARPTMPKKRRGILHGSGAVPPSEKGKGKLQKWPNFPLVSGIVWHVNVSLHHAKPPRDTNAPTPK